MYRVKITTLKHQYHTGNVSMTVFSSWQNAVDYACPFEKSPNYHVAMYRSGKPVSYYSNQDMIDVQ